MIELYYVGRFVERGKRISLLLDLAEKLTSHGINFRFNIFSAVDFKNPDYNLFIKNSNFIFHGHVDQWYKSISENAIMILVTKYEGCPLAILEAYRFKLKKILMLRIPGISNYVSDNCLAETTDEMAQKLICGNNLTNTMDLGTYFDPIRFKSEVKALEDRL